MCGTTSELTEGLEKHKDTLQYIACDPSDVLCVHYIRIGNFTRTKTESLISIAPLVSWWGAGVTVPQAGRNLGWKPLKKEPIVSGILIDDLIKLIALARNKSAKIHI
jgi:hypothetical protein